jgi:hypothetical protein
MHERVASRHHFLQDVRGKPSAYRLPIRPIQANEERDGEDRASDEECRRRPTRIPPAESLVNQHDGANGDDDRTKTSRGAEDDDPGDFRQLIGFLVVVQKGVDPDDHGHGGNEEHCSRGSPVQASVTV